MIFYEGSSVAVSSIILIKKSVKLHKSVFVQNKLFLLQFLVSGSWSYKTLGWKYYIGYSKGILDALKPTGILKTLPVCVKIPQPGRKYSPAVKIKIPNGGVMSRWHQASVYLSSQVAWKYQNDPWPGHCHFDSCSSSQHHLVHIAALVNVVQYYRTYENGSL